MKDPPNNKGSTSKGSRGPAAAAASPKGRIPTASSSSSALPTSNGTAKISTPDAKASMKKKSSSKTDVAAVSASPAAAISSSQAAASKSKASVDASSSQPQVKPSKSKTKASQGQESSSRSRDSVKELLYSPLVQGKATGLPVVFTKDADYFCVASASSVKIHARTTGEVVSTLSHLEADVASQAEARNKAHIAEITGLMVHPQNPLQLITASLDGTIKIWDYLDAILLKSIDVGYPITHLAAHASIADSLFVSVRKPKATQSGKKPDPYNFSGRTNSIIYSVSLDVTGGRSGSSGGVVSRKPRDLHRLGKTRDASGLQISPDGKWLVAIGNRKVQVAKTSALREGFTKFVSDERLVSLAFHPTEPTFATGDATGKIRLWYCLDEQTMANTASEAGAEKRVATTLLHWHAHAVSSLAFTPNGAYLVSGGEEAVMVLWQLSTQQREYVPRLGAPINTITVADGMDGREQEFVLGLADGSITFVGALNLKTTRTFARVKVDPSRILLPPAKLATLPAPLAVEPCTGQIVLASGHPSTLQFFDPTNDRVVSELEVVPSNRVSRPDETPLEPSRIERVVFSSQPREDAAGASAEWMATVDSRQGGSLTAEVALKFWRFDVSTSRYLLNTRIDKPHGEETISSMSFSPSNASDDPSDLLFVTTGLDGKVKTWRIGSHTARGRARLELYWVPRSVFGYRETIPMKAVWSPDGSILAIAQGPFLTLWEPLSNSLITALSCPELKTATHAEFVGRAGRYVAVGSGKTLVLWDLVLSCVQWHRTLDESIEQVIKMGQDGAGDLVLLRSAPASQHSRRGRATIAEVYSVKSAQPIETYRLAAGVRTVASLPSNSKAQSGSLSVAGTSYPPRFIAITNDFDLLDVGSAHGSDSGAGPSRTTSSTAAQSLRTLSIKRRTLFDDLFGSTSADEEQEALLAAQQQQQAATLAAAADGKRKGGSREVFALFDAPAHLLPPVRMLFDAFVGTVLPPPRAAAAEVVKQAEVVEAQGQEQAGETVVASQTYTPGRSQQEEEEDLAFLTDMFAKQLSTTKSSHAEERREDEVMTSPVASTPISKKKGKGMSNGIVATSPPIAASTPGSASKGAEKKTSSSKASTSGGGAGKKRKSLS